MNITITGRLGSGKSTVCEVLKNKYSYIIYSTGAIHRKMAREQKLSTLELNKKMMSNFEMDKIIDDSIIEFSKKNQKTAFDSRMAGFLLEDAFKVFLTIDPVVAATRVFENRESEEESYTDISDTLTSLQSRENEEKVRFKKIYNVDIDLYSNYDLIIDATWSSAENIADIIMNIISHSDFSPTTKRNSEILLSPKSLYPTQSLRVISSGKVNELHNEDEITDEEIIISPLDRYHYIVDGHHRTLESIKNGTDFISAKIIDDKMNFYYEEDNLRAQLSTLSLSTLKDFEDYAGFRYKSYPSTYKGNE